MEPHRGGSGLSRIEHVVVFMQENRSYDHYFGAYPHGRGFSDPDAIDLPGGRDVFHQPDPGRPEGYLLPFHLDTGLAAGANPGDVDHSWGGGHDVFNGAAYDGWIGAKGPRAMGYYTRRDMAYYYGLADAFTLCDAYHCSALSSTAPNRLYLMSGTIDPDGHNGGPEFDDSVQQPAFTWTTYPERLERAGVSWQVYQTPDNFNDNALAWFAQYQSAPAASPLARKGMASTGIDRWLRGRPQRHPAERLVDHLVGRVLGASGQRLAGARLLADRSARAGAPRQPEGVAQDGVHPQLRRERRTSSTTSCRRCHRPGRPRSSSAASRSASVSVCRC